MSRTLLLIICDFLLISVLSLMRLDSTHIDEPRDQRPEIRHAEGMQDDMVELLRLSLEAEAAHREALGADLVARETELAEREAALDETARDRDETADELARIREEREALAAEREQMQAEFREAQTIIAQGAEEQSRIASELEAQRRQAQQLQAELQSRQNALAQAEQTLAELEREAADLARVRSELETDLQITQTEREMLRENLTAARTEVERARVERQQAEQRAEQLASNVGALAERSTAIEAEIRRAQPISLNEIFSRYEGNRLTLRFLARVDALFGSRAENAEIDAILVRSGGRTFALFESGLTPLRVENLNRLRSVRAQFEINDRNFAIVEASFLQADPRIVAVEIPEQLVESSNLTPFDLTDEPLRFPEVVLVSNELGEFGEAAFRLLPGGQRYLSVPNRMLGRVFGNDFGASRGDYIFAKTGDLMGVMLSGDRGAILSELQSAGDLPIGSEYDQEQAARLHNDLMNTLLQSPVRPPGSTAPTTSPRR